MRRLNKLQQEGIPAVQVTNLIEHREHINHLELRSDLENGNIEWELLLPQGKIHAGPETWAIDLEHGENSYLYQSKAEYEQDLAILNSKFKPRETVADSEHVGDIPEGNKLFAEFLHIKPNPGGEYDMYQIIGAIPDEPAAKHFYFPKEMLFHSSWDWLLVVIEKIVEIYEEPEMLDSYTDIFIREGKIYTSINIEGVWQDAVHIVKNSI